MQSFIPAIRLRVTGVGANIGQAETLHEGAPFLADELQPAGQEQPTAQLLPGTLNGDCHLFGAGEEQDFAIDQITTIRVRHVHQPEPAPGG